MFPLGARRWPWEITETSTDEQPHGRPGSTRGGPVARRHRPRTGALVTGQNKPASTHGGPSR
jgi:hypothetical protein